MATLHVPNTFNNIDSKTENLDDPKAQRITRFPAAADFRSPKQPPSTSDSWGNESVPPPYNNIDPTDVASYQAQATRDWAYDASRIAARNALQKRFSIGNTARQKSKKKPKQQTTITVDTSCLAHQGEVPRQIFPQAGKEDAVIYINEADMTSSEERDAWSKSKWMRKLGFGGKKEESERIAPVYELQSQPDRTPLPYDNGFRFKTKTLRANPPPQALPVPTSLPVPSSPTLEAANQPNPSRLSLSDISPSDRPITIGLSVSPEQASEYQASPDPGSAHPNTYLDTNRRMSIGGASVDTPTIVVTPAQENSGWLLPPNNGLHAPRPASSVYSRGTNCFTLYNNLNLKDAPPVPALPPHMFAHKESPREMTREFDVPEHRRTPGGYGIQGSPQYSPSIEDTPKRKRIMSGQTEGTMFEEDMTPTSAKTEVRGPNGLYVDTNIPPTPRRSQGWWNVITTPFAMTPNRWKFSPSSEASTPDVPMVPAAASFSGVQRQQSLKPRTLASPDARFSVATWERNSPDSTPRMHDDLGIYRAPDFSSSPSPPTEDFHDDADNQGSGKAQGSGSGQGPVAGMQGSAAAKADSPPPATIKSNQNSPHNVYIVNNYSHTQNIQQSEGTITRSGTLKSTDTIPVLGVASLGTVLSARAVHEPHNPNAQYLSSGRTAALETATPPMVSAERRPSAPHDISVPYFAPPPNYLHPEYPQQAYTQHGYPQHGYSQHSAHDYQHHGYQHYAADAPPSPRGGTRRPFPKDGRIHEYEKPVKPAKPARQKGAGGYWSLAKFFRGNKTGQASQVATNPTKKRRRRWCCWCCLLFLILLVIMAVLLGILIPRMHHNETADVQSQWLNLTGYPPIPTGVATIARPNNNHAESGCVSPQTMWSCDVPKEEQAGLAPNDPSQPNFKLQIQFVNGTVSDVSALQPKKAVVRRANAPTADPAMPDLEDQAFLGNTTDGNSKPFVGEETPFFISFLTGDHVSSRRVKRANDDDSSPTTSETSSTTRRSSSATSSTRHASSKTASSTAAATSSSSGNLASFIPAPDIASDGTAAAANIFPFPENQRLRLYNRGQADEHYGFYTYYDRSIFLKNNIASNSSDTGELVSDQNGGSAKDAARVRCTWRQTRYLVQIWTNSESSKPLLLSASTATSTASASSATSTAQPATDFSRPGSFPYPVTITLDRHGGNITEKSIYCYGMDDDTKILKDQVKFQLENRNFGGSLVNPAQGPFGGVNVSIADGGPGGIDGGTGGCGCQWRNWETR
ncbi:uncharacterized protein K452DRAFT_282617 [Aplosporella prunicola CBS 121167]|uniref:Glycoprotease family protein n=1 Tax=Aplosporella prunicola CBS 121167 TaxID=1176127 RepID=A0A6A6BUG0_9PEZI|nr:uncharacterized protein K452DRAFT_282617 [Aplosporella prunicola CBS 121167]KAF2146447.1 hypothetical protein K452DRAFT_282617 [Aplosporella prunicola CBS 121167]